MKQLFLFSALIISGSIFWSCDKDEPVPPDTIDSFENGVLITCEGGFGLGNATVYFLDPLKMGYIPEIFNLVNNELVGDVLQSIGFAEDKAYMVVNNSGKIIEADDNTFLKTGTIEGLSSPTEIEIEDGKGYIGSLYSRNILVAEMSLLTVTDSLYLGKQSNRIHINNNRLWVLSQSEYLGPTQDHIFYINLSDSSLDSIKVGSNPQDWAFDDNNQLYVYCQGKESSDDPGLFTIDMSAPSPSVIENTDVNVPVGFFGKIAYDDVENRILVQLTDGIYSYNIFDGILGSTPLVDLGDVQFLYSLDVSPVDGDIYVGDAKDFSSAGTVYTFAGDGQPKSILQVGVGPNHFYFR